VVRGGWSQAGGYPGKAVISQEPPSSLESQRWSVPEHRIAAVCQV
jgi:hypothetical protein